MSSVSRCVVCSRKARHQCERHEAPLCRFCECVWVMEMGERGMFRHVVKGAASPYLRWYMGKWPRELPPPKNKRMARDAENIQPFLGALLERMTVALAPAWDREDALLAIAEMAMRVHARDAETIDRWNAYVERENAKRRRRFLKGWTNNYYARTLLKEIPQDDDASPRDSSPASDPE